MAIQQILLQIEGDPDDAQRALAEVSGDLQAFDAQEAEAEATVDTDQAERSLEELQSDLARFARIVATAEANVDADEGQRTLREIRVALEAIDVAHADATVTANIARALVQLEIVEAEVTRLDGQDATIDVDVRRGAVERITSLVGVVGRLAPSLGSVAPAASSAQGGISSMVSSMTGGIPIIGKMGAVGGGLAAVLALVLVGAVVQVAAALTAMVASLSAAVLGLAALGTAALGAGVVLGGFIAGAVSRFNRLKDEAGTAAHALSDAMSDLGQAARKAMGPGIDASFRGATSALRAFRPTIEALRGPFTQLGRAAGDALRGIGQALASPEIRSGLAQLIRGTGRLVGPIAEGMTNLFRIFLKIANAAMPALVRGAQSLADWLGKIADNPLSTFRGAIQSLIGHLSSAFELARELGRVVINFFRAAAPAGKGLIDSLAGAAGKLADFLGTAEGMAQVRQFFADIVPPVIAVGKAVISLIGFLIKLGVATAPAVRLLAAGFALLFKILGFALDLIIGLYRQMGLLGRAGEGVGSSFRAIGEVIRAVAGFIKGAWTGAIKAIAGLWERLRARAGDLWGSIKDRVVGLVKGAVNGVRNAWQRGLDALANLWGKIKEKAASLWRSITDVVKNTVSAVTGFVRDRWRNVSQFLANLWGGIKDRASSIWKGITGAIRDAVSAVAGFIKERWREVTGFLSEVWGKIKEKASSAFKSIADTITNAFEDVLDFLGSLPGRFFDAGRAIIQGLVDGIKSLASAPGDAVKGIIGGVADLLPGSEPKDRSSPLRRLNKRGEALVRNFADGVRGERKYLARTMRRNLLDPRFFQPIKDAAKDAVKPLNDALAMQPSLPVVSEAIRARLEVGNQPLRSGRGNLPAGTVIEQQTINVPTTLSQEPLDAQTLARSLGFLLRAQGARTK